MSGKTTKAKRLHKRLHRMTRELLGHHDLRGTHLAVHGETREVQAA